MLELSPRWARNMVTALARLDGRPVGVVANQPRHLGGVIDAAAAEKAARFVRALRRASACRWWCSSTPPASCPGRTQEEAGRDPPRRRRCCTRSPRRPCRRLTVVLRKAYGGAFITMNSRELGADLVFAWPRAEIGDAWAPRQAVGIVHRRAIAAADDPGGERDRLAAEYAERAPDRRGGGRERLRRRGDRAGGDRATGSPGRWRALGGG